MIYFLFSILLLFLVIFLIDVIPQFSTWQGRIKIGRFRDREIWQNSVLAVCEKWLKRTPVIRMTDHSRLIFIDILRGNYHKPSIQSWQEAALLFGLYEHQVKRGQDHSPEIQRYISTKIDNTGNWLVPPSSVDAGMLAYALMVADAQNLVRNRPAFDEMYRLILTLVGTDGTVAYRKSVPDKRFVDTVGFVSPFLVHYGLSFNQPQAVSLGIRQITEYVKYGFSVSENLPCHTYDIHSHHQVGLTGWGRGLAWFLIGLTDTWRLLPESHTEKEYLKNLMVQTAKNSFQFQDSDGSFHWLLTDNSSRKDSSVTSVLAWFFSAAEAFSEIAKDCEMSKNSALQYLMSVTRRNGAVDFSQGDTKAIGIYSQYFDILPFTQGFVLRSLNNLYAL